MMARLHGPSPAQFAASLAHVPGSECLVWTKGLTGNGYGRLVVGGQRVRAHRYAWEMTHGPIPTGFCVLHACDVPTCVNVKHLFLGTHADNARDRDTKKRGRESRLTHCPKGHEYAGANLYRKPNGERNCRACRRAAERARARTAFKRRNSAHRNGGPGGTSTWAGKGNQGK